MAKLDVLVADDHDIVRRGLRDLIERQPGWKVVGEATNGREAVEKTKQLKPDVSILDISMPSLNGLEAARQIVASGSSTKVLILTIHQSDPLIQQMVKAGVRGYVLKTDAASELVHAVEALQRNKTFFTSKVAQCFPGRAAEGGQKQQWRRPSPQAHPPAAGDRAVTGGGKE